MSAPEFSRIVDLRQADGRAISIGADPAERRALARRFGLVRIDRLTAELTLDRQGDTVAVHGSLAAAIVQSCAVSAEDLAAALAEPVTLRFVPARRDHRPDEEIELTAEDCDEIEYTGAGIDIGEAVAQSLALAIDPFAVGPDADRARREGGITAPEAAGPFAALAALRGEH